MTISHRTPDQLVHFSHLTLLSLNVLIIRALVAMFLRKWARRAPGLAAPALSGNYAGPARYPAERPGNAGHRAIHPSQRTGPEHAAQSGVAHGKAAGAVPGTG